MRREGGARNHMTGAAAAPEESTMRVQWDPGCRVFGIVYSGMYKGTDLAGSG